MTTHLAQVGEIWLVQSQEYDWWSLLLLLAVRHSEYWALELAGNFECDIGTISNWANWGNLADSVVATKVSA